MIARERISTGYWIVWKKKKNFWFDFYRDHAVDSSGLVWTLAFLNVTLNLAATLLLRDQIRVNWTAVAALVVHL